MYNRILLVLWIWKVGVFWVRPADPDVVAASYQTNVVDINLDGKPDGSLIYERFDLTRATDGSSRYNGRIKLKIDPPGRLYYHELSQIVLNASSSAVPKVFLNDRVAEIPSGSGWVEEIPIWHRGSDKDGRVGFFGVFADGKALVFGFALLGADGMHFGWSRLQGVNGATPAANAIYNFNTNYPPVFTQMIINPVPWAGIDLGRQSPGGPEIKVARLNSQLMRISYPSWGDRYAIRKRQSLNGNLFDVYPSGREGLVPVESLQSFVIDVPMDKSGEYFELYLPSTNRFP